MSARIWRVMLMGLCAGVLVCAGFDAHAFVPYRAFNSYQKLVYLTWSWGTLNDANNDGDISGADEGLEVLVEGGTNGFTEDEQKIVREAFDVWQDVPTSYIGFQLVGPTSDPLPFGEVNDFINSVQIQVDTDPNQVADVGDGVLGLTIFTVLVDDGYYPDNATGTGGTGGTTTGTGTTSGTTTGGVSTYISGGQLLEADILIDGTTHRSAIAGQKPLASLRSTLVHEIGHFIGLDHTPLNNIEAATIAGTTVLMESPVVALRDASNVLRIVGATPTMFPIQFFTDDGHSSLVDGGDTLAPDDIAGVSFIYPRGSQDAFFAVEQEARTQTRDAIPSIPLIGGHIVAWCDVDNDPNTPRIPLFSTVSGYYQQQPITGGRFALYGLYKVMETTTGVEPFSATYTFTLNPLNSLDFGRQAPLGYTPEDFMGDTSWGGQSPLPPVFPSEVFHEKGNIFDISKHDLGTAMAFDRKRSKAISVDSGKTLATIRPWIEPMFGDPEPVCPWNVVFNPSGTNTTTTTASLRTLRDDVLLKTAVGTAVVDLYYHMAPSMAAFLMRHSGVLSALRFVAPAVEWSMVHLRMVLAVMLVLVSVALAARRRTKGFAVSILILVLALGSVPAFGSVMNLSDEEMVRMSDDIVTGTVQTVESRYVERDGKRGIVTDVGILLDDNVKGGLNKSSTIYLTVLGGRVGNVLTVASESPAFKVGQNILIYLREKNDGSYTVIAGTRGKFDVQTDTASGKKFLVGPSELSNAALAATAAKNGTTNKKSLANLDEVKIPLDDYKEYLRALVNAQKK